MSLWFPASYWAWGIQNLAKACLFALICLICSSPVPSVLQSYQPFCYSLLCVPYPFLPDGHGAFCAIGVEYCPVTLHMASNPHSPLKQHFHRSIPLPLSAVSCRPQCVYKSVLFHHKSRNLGVVFVTGYFFCWFGFALFGFIFCFAVLLPLPWTALSNYLLDEYMAHPQ